MLIMTYIYILKQKIILYHSVDHNISLSLNFIDLCKKKIQLCDVQKKPSVKFKNRI